MFYKWKHVLNHNQNHCLHHVQIQMFKFQITYTINDHAMIIFNDLGDHLANNKTLLVKILASTHFYLKGNFPSWLLNNSLIS